METKELIENGKEVKTNGQLCAEEIDGLLKKYNCTLISQKQIIYGQVVWVPSVEEIKKQS